MKRFVLIAQFKRLPGSLSATMAKDKAEAGQIFASRLNANSRIKWSAKVLSSFVREDNGQLSFI